MCCRCSSTKLGDCCASGSKGAVNFGFRYFFQLISALNGSFVFVLALQFNEIVQREINKDNGLTVYDIEEHLSRIGILALGIVILSLVKEGMLTLKTEAIHDIESVESRLGLMKTLRQTAVGAKDRTVPISTKLAEQNTNMMGKALQMHEMHELMPLMGKGQHF